MQEYVDDYVKFTQKVKSEESPTETKKELQNSFQRKKECNARALKVVEFSVDGKVKPDILALSLPYINQSHYQDIVEERAISKLCGYSICGKKIPDMPKKQYYISTKSNRVYDITDRKNYCSNFCYKASVHIKKQIDDSPLWSRKYDYIPQYNFLGIEDCGLPGELIDQGITKPVGEPSFTSVINFTEASLTDMIPLEKEKPREQKKNRRPAKQKKLKLLKTMPTLREKPEQIEEEEEEKVIQPQPEHRFLQKSASLPVIIENEENIDTVYEKWSCENLNNSTSDISVKSETRKIKKKSSKSARPNYEDILRKVVREWLSLESFIFLHGEAKVKEILSAKKLSDCFEKLHIAKMQREQQIKYMDICKRLHLQEMADEKFDSSVLGTQMKPLPDYGKLKQDNKELNLKVKSFYSGVLHEREDSNFPTKANKSDNASEESKGAEETPAVLPLVDVHSQKAMRRKIFLTAINKSMNRLLQILSVKFFTTVLCDLQLLVKTFNLTAENIVFKPILLHYISIILLNILAVKDSNLRNVLENKYSVEYVKLQLSVLPSKEGIISEIMKEVCDVEMFIENYISTN